MSKKGKQTSTELVLPEKGSIVGQGYRFYKKPKTGAFSRKPVATHTMLTHWQKYWDNYDDDNDTESKKVPESDLNKPFLTLKRKEVVISISGLKSPIVVIGDRDSLLKVFMASDNYGILRNEWIKLNKMNFFPEGTDVPAAVVRKSGAKAKSTPEPSLSRNQAVKLFEAMTFYEEDEKGEVLTNEDFYSYDKFTRDEESGRYLMDEMEKEEEVILEIKDLFYYADAFRFTKTDKAPKLVDNNVPASRPSQKSKSKADEALETSEQE